MSIAGEPKSIKNLRSGDLLIQCTKQPHEANLLKMKTFCGLKCTVTPHKSLNTSRGIVRCRDGGLKPTNTFVFTFDSPVLPANVKIGFIQAKVDVYIPNPLRCYKCQVFGHHENKCGRQVICVNCSMPEHCQPGQCERPAKCANCSGAHSANSKECPQWEKEKKILKSKCEQNISFPEARKQYEQFYQTRTYASAVKPGTCNKSTETHNNSTQTDDSFTEYLKQTQEKQKEPQKGKPKEKSTSSSLSGPALKPATLEMIRKEGEKKKKEEKETLKKTRKRRKTKTISQRKRTKRKRRSRKSNTFLCLKRMMRKMTWKMILWFSQILPPVITSLKAHFYDYQQLKQWKV